MIMRRRGLRKAIIAAPVLATLVCADPAPARAGGRLDGLSDFLSRTPPTTTDSPAAPASHVAPLAWWSIPRRARAAMREMAASRDARVTRCLLVEHEDEVIYEIHARRRLGLFRTEDFVLTRFGEPREDADSRRESRTLRGRWESLRDALRPGPSSHP